MRGNERGHVAVPTSEQNGGASIIELRQTETAVLLGNFDSESADRRKAGEIFGRNFARSVDLVRIDMFAQISFEFVEKIFTGGAILRALRRPRVNSIEVVSPDEKIAGETAAIIQRIARSFRQFQRGALAFRHL